MNVPEWQVENCIQCNQCAYVCPHAVIRPFLRNRDRSSRCIGHRVETGVGRRRRTTSSASRSRRSTVRAAATAWTFAPPRRRRCVMKPLESQLGTAEELGLHHQTYRLQEGGRQDQDRSRTCSSRSRSFEFSGACAGCGETPYIKAISQLFGDQMMVANATGCTSIYSAVRLLRRLTAPMTKGQGPAWANSLFEDNAEFGLGMHVGVGEAARPDSGVLMEQAIARLHEVLRRAEGRHAGVDRSARFVGQVGRGCGPPDPDDGGLRLRLLQGAFWR